MIMIYSSTDITEKYPYQAIFYACISRRDLARTSDPFGLGRLDGWQVLGIPMRENPKLPRGDQTLAIFLRQIIHTVKNGSTCVFPTKSAT